MEWIEIDINNLPEFEILAANFKSGTYGYQDKLMGYLSEAEGEDGMFVCQDEYQMLENCTHYIDLSKFDLK